MRKFSIPTDLTKALHFINGARVNLTAGQRLEVVEPRNGEILAECNAATAEEVGDVAELSRWAQRQWALTSWAERRQVLQRAAGTHLGVRAIRCLRHFPSLGLIRRHVGDIAMWETRDNGKSIVEAKADVLSCADTFDYFSGADLSGEHIPYEEGGHRFAYTRREPLGVCGAIGAWNYPLQTATWKIAPAVACGNAVVYKPSPMTPITSVLLAQILQCAGLPDGIVNVVQGGVETGSALCDSRLINKISFTGSVATGQSIAASCAKANLKQVTLELGGKSSCIMLPDCDLEMAVNGALMANFYSQGQVCTNASKILVHRSILEEFTTRLLEKTKDMTIGDPINESTHVGASISLPHVERIQRYISQAVGEGAKLLCGGERVVVEALEKGYYLSPCVLSEVTPQMNIYKEEVFGAVLLVIPFEEEEHALAMANDTEFRLAAGVFTNELNKAYQFAARLEAGTVYVNTYNDISPHVPFGGYRMSGYGRENGKAAISAYTQLKSVFVNAAGHLDNPFP